MNKTDPPALAYRVKQVSEMLNVGRSTVHEWVRTGKIASVRLGEGERKLTLIPASAVEELMSKNLHPVRPSRSGSTRW